MSFATTVLFLFALLFSNNRQGECQGFSANSISLEINRQVRDSLKPLEGLGEKISRQVHQNLRGLENLGPLIQNSVFESLQPVYQMQDEMTVRFGVGGVTIATYQPGGKEFIIRNYVKYICNGEIDQETGKCSVDLIAFNATKPDDICFSTSRTIINDHMCFPSNGHGVHVTSFNGQVHCEGSDGSAAILITVQDYNKKCKEVASSVSYTYFPDQNRTFGGRIQCSTTAQGRAKCQLED